MSYTHWYIRHDFCDNFFYLRIFLQLLTNKLLTCLVNLFDHKLHIYPKTRQNVTKLGTKIELGMRFFFPDHFQVLKEEMDIDDATLISEHWGMKKKGFTY